MPPAPKFDLNGSALTDVYYFYSDKNPVIKPLDECSTTEAYSGEIVGGVQLRVQPPPLPPSANLFVP